MNETSNDFVMGIVTKDGAVGNEILEPQTNSRSNNLGRSTIGETFAGQNQVLEKNFDDKIRRAVDNTVMTVKTRMHDAILTAMDSVVIS